MMFDGRALKIAALAGGVGASKLLLGLSCLAEPPNLTIIANTGDDLTLHGLEICPDLDIISYTLAGEANPKTGWGLDGDTFSALGRLRKLGAPGWFQLGDRDLATHIYRTARLRQGATLSRVTQEISAALGLNATLLPMSDGPVRTIVHTTGGALEFQEYFVKYGTRPTVRSVTFAGAARARPAPGVLRALRNADGILICPSNPLISIGPILAVPGIREELRRRREKVLAVSPIVAGRSLKGPSDRMMRQTGHQASALGVAKMYRQICGTMIIDRADAAQAEGIGELAMRVICAETIMRSLRQKIRLAEVVVAALAHEKG
jgi:LPPG:FO 2-phospho-L-lactate transferase